MKKGILLILALFTFCLAQAQQDPMYTMYMFNKLPINPGYAGSSGGVSATMLYRTQWVGFEGSPTTAAFSLDAPLFNDISGVGISVVQDELGISENLYLSGYFAYRFQAFGGTMGLGISGEIKRQQMNWSEVNPLDRTDPNLTYTNDNLFLPNVGVGIYWQSETAFAGVSMPRIIENDLDYNPTGITTFTSSAAQRRHFFGMAGFIATLSSELKLRPMALVKYVENAPVEVDLNLAALISDLIWVGAGYRTDDSYSAMVTLNLGDNFRLGYAHDFTYTRLNAYHNGTHEIMLGFDLGKREKGVYHPRYF